MPGRNGTGPNGQGSMTGRGLGLCTGANQQAGNFYNRGMARARGGGRGMGCRGFGFGAGYAQTFVQTPQDELAVLKQQAENSQKNLEGIMARIDFLEKANNQENDS